jgi:hypothetical protein
VRLWTRFSWFRYGDQRSTLFNIVNNIRVRKKARIFGPAERILASEVMFSMELVRT